MAAGILKRDKSRLILNLSSILEYYIYKNIINKSKEKNLQKYEFNVRITKRDWLRDTKH